MQIEVKGRNTPVTDDLRALADRRVRKVAAQVSDLANLEVEIYEERNPANPLSCVAETTLHLKGVTLRACARARDMGHALNLCSEELARQVKRHRDKRRKRREARAAQPRPAEIRL
jgi:putative sigma-54 modulation protein